MWNNTERLLRIFAGWKIGWIICAEHRNKKFFDPAIFQKCWRDSGRVALIAARRQRNPCAILLGKPIFSVRQKGVPPLLLPASVQQLPRCLVRICNLFHKDNQLRIGKFQRMQLQQENQSSKSNLLRKCGLLAHTSAAFLKNCCTEKLFIACGSLFAAKIVLFWCDVSRETFWNCS